MASFRTFMFFMQVVPGLLIIVLSVPLIRRRVAPNHWYGFRVRRTLEDSTVWYEANAHAGKCLFSAGIVIVAGSVALYEVSALDGPTYALACMLISLSAVASALILSLRFLGQIATPTKH